MIYLQDHLLKKFAFINFCNVYKQDICSSHVLQEVPHGLHRR